MSRTLLILLSLGLALAADLQEFASGSRKFTSAVYNELLLDNKDNILVSPFSVETVLALTEAGAQDETATEIRAGLSLPNTEEETEAVMKTVLPIFKGQKYSLKTANKVYVENSFAIKDGFKKVATDVYEAQFENIEFGESAKAAEEINTWVEEQTAGKIHDLIGADDLSAETKVVLVNALYFQANWSQPFAPRKTKKAQFFTSAADSIETDAMYVESLAAKYYESPDLDAQYLELPFQGEGASMTFILPNKKEGIALLEKQADAVLLTPAYSDELVEISLPKFKIESSIDFTSVLPDLGIKRAFSAAEADFSGIAGEKGDIFIDKIAQKTYIDVNEIGVEAAAATEIAEPNSAPLPKTKSFIADHPFMFYIKVNDIILFEGRVLAPEYKN